MLGRRVTTAAHTAAKLHKPLGPAICSLLKAGCPSFLILSCSRDIDSGPFSPCFLCASLHTLMLLKYPRGSQIHQGYLSSFVYQDALVMLLLAKSSQLVFEIPKPSEITWALDWTHKSATRLIGLGDECKPQPCEPSSPHIMCHFFTLCPPPPAPAASPSPVSTVSWCV